MKYRDAIKHAMEELARDQRTIFLGYNVLYGSRAYGTLDGVPSEQCLETPVAENLMAGLAIGMALAGYRPVLFFERHDFVLNALDAIVNHLDKLESMSHGQFRAPVIIRATVGGRAPLHPGPQHTQDFTEAFRSMLTFPVLDITTPAEVQDAYRLAGQFDTPVMLVERRDLY
jgi:pyruvate/2-oxoglutarate/acetoin dehydrogenase E1 component